MEQISMKKKPKIYEMIEMEDSKPENTWIKMNLRFGSDVGAILPYTNLFLNTIVVLKFFNW